MPTYKTTYTWMEDGMNDPTIDIIIFSDSFLNLGNVAGAIEVNVFAASSTKQAIEKAAGTFMTSSLSFTIDGDKLLTLDDANARDFVLTAATGTTIYCARLINPAVTPVVADFVFRGKVDKTFGGDDLQWYGSEWDGNITPLRTWSGTASVIDLGVILDTTVGEVVDTFRFGLDEITGEINYGEGFTAEYLTWKEDEVEDRLAYFRGYLPSFDVEALEAETEYGWGETRYANLLSLESAFAMLLDTVDALGMSFIYQSNYLDLYMIPARWNVLRSEGKAYRYVDLRFTPKVTPPLHGTYKDAYRLKLGDTGAANNEGAPYITFDLLLPEYGDDDREIAFTWRPLSLAELFFRIAYTFGAFLNITYVDLDTAIIEFVPRSSVGTATEFFIREAVQAKIDIAPIDPDSIPHLIGAAHEKTKEGLYAYVHDREGLHPMTRSDESTNAPLRGDKYLPLTLSPTWCFFMDNTATDAGVEFEERGHYPCLPHNTVFWSGTNAGTSARQINATGTVDSGAFAGANLQDVHTAIYLSVAKGETPYVDPFTAATIGEYLQGANHNFAPVMQMKTKIRNKDKLFSTLEQYTREMRVLDLEHYALDNTKELTFSGLRNPFRSSPGGTSDWRHVQAGFKIEQEGVDWVVIEVERKQYETTLKLQRLSRFLDFQAPPAPLGTEVEESPPPTSFKLPYNTEEHKSEQSVVKRYKAGDEIVKFMYLSEIDRLVYTSEAKASHYAAVRGMSIGDYDPEINSPAEMIAVQTAGRVYIGALATTLGLSAGDRLYLHNNAVPVNWSNVPPDPALGETLFFEIGYVLPDGKTIMIEPKGKFIFN